MLRSVERHRLFRVVRQVRGFGVSQKLGLIQAYLIGITPITKAILAVKVPGADFLWV
jgi:hypothetical protein